jgi:hypothetical protein
MSEFAPHVESSSARTEGDVTVPAAVGDLPDLLRLVLAKDDHYTIKSSDPNGAELSRRINWRTWGEVLTLTFTSVGATETIVAVQSQPTFALQGYDWGQSEKDVRDLLNALWTEAVGAQPAGS